MAGGHGSFEKWYQLVFAKVRASGVWRARSMQSTYSIETAEGALENPALTCLPINHVIKNRLPAVQSRDRWCKIRGKRFCFYPFHAGTAFGFLSSALKVSCHFPLIPEHPPCFVHPRAWTKNPSVLGWNFLRVLESTTCPPDQFIMQSWHRLKDPLCKWMTRIGQGSLTLHQNQ